MRRRLILALMLAPAVLIAGTAGYMLIEKWGLFDALYMTVITVWTVGFEEVRPLSGAGRAFTLVLILGGVGALAYAVGTFVEFTLEGHLKGILEERRMRRDIDDLSGHHIIAGLGRVGSVVARQLAAEGAGFVVVDRDESAIAVADEAGWLHVRGDAAEEEVLLEAGVARAKSLVCALDTDADNTFVTLTAKQLNPGIHVVARTSTESAEGKLLKAGADRVITPSVIGGRRLAAMVLHPLVSNYLELVTHSEDMEFRIEEIEVGAGSPLDGSSVGDAHVKHRTGTYILAVHSAEGVVTDVRRETVMRAGDRLIVLGSSSQIDALATLGSA